MTKYKKMSHGLKILFSKDVNFYVRRVLTLFDGRPAERAQNVEHAMCRLNHTLPAVDERVRIMVVSGRCSVLVRKCLQ